MSRIGEVWQLRHGDALLGEITITGEGATPDWLHGSFAGQSLFAEFAPLLTDEHDLYQTMTSEFSDETYSVFKAHHAQVLATITLVAPEGPVVDYQLEVVSDDFATFGWSDSPLWE
jgi:hypothetical protein